jgi:uncharacterized caspase-like protein/tetratricopeptide (TPR) repeat protein
MAIFRSTKRPEAVHALSDEGRSGASGSSDASAAGPAAEAQGLASGRELNIAPEADENWFEHERAVERGLVVPPATRGGARFKAEDVAWSGDDRNPEYGHLDKSLGAKEFAFGPKELELIIRASRFEPSRSSGVILFGIRGAELVGGGSQLNKDTIRLRDARPDHRAFRCVIGAYHVGRQQLSAFTGSTVPNTNAVYTNWARHQSGAAPYGNMLLSGCYRYRVGTHVGTHEVPGAFRLQEDAEVVVLRSNADVTYDTGDVFDQCVPHDNLHPALRSMSFSSAGCQTVRGTYNADQGHTGEWAEFRKAVGLKGASDNGKRFDYVLVTGLEAGIASRTLADAATARDEAAIRARLTRLRYGSRGAEVAALQAALKRPATGFLDAGDRMALADLQRQKLGSADATYSPAMDTKLGLGVFDAGAVVASAPTRTMAPAAAERIALVIGNGAYQSAGARLANPPNDAEAIAAELDKLGFKVTRLIDKTRAEMADAIGTFIERLDNPDVNAEAGLVFYAGHGVQIDGENYILPVDCSPKNVVSLINSSLSLDDIVRQVEKSKKAGLVFLDCCRNNPFPSPTRSLGGLAQVDAPAGIFIAFATAPGAVAMDGDNAQNSPFTTSLLSHIPTSGISVSQLMIRVRRDVVKKSGGQQIPWDSSSLLVDFAFKPTESGGAEQQQPLTLEELQARRREETAKKEAESWEYTRQSSSEQLLRSFITQYPYSSHRDAAQKKLYWVRNKRRLLYASCVAVVIGAAVAYFQYEENQLRKSWQGHAFIGQFGQLLAKASEKLSSRSEDEARAFPIAARHQVEADAQKWGSGLDKKSLERYGHILAETMPLDPGQLPLAHARLSTTAVKAVFTPDGSRIVWAADNEDSATPGTLSVSESESGRLVGRQDRIAAKLRTLIVSSGGSHAALLSTAGDAELFKIDGGEGVNDYIDVYIPSNVEAIAFGGTDKSPFLAAVDRNGDLLAWRFNPKGGRLQKVSPLPRKRGALRPSDSHGGFAISCHENLCLWVEPDGDVFAATLPGGRSKWERIEPKEVEKAKIEGWAPRGFYRPDVERPDAGRQMAQLAKNLLFTYSQGRLSAYQATVKDGRELVLAKRWEANETRPLDAMRLDGQHLTLFVRPARAGDLPRVETLDITLLEAEGGDKPPTLAYLRSFEARSILDFTLATRSVVFPAQITTDRLTLVRRTNVPTGAPEMSCFTACDQLTWLGTSGDLIIGVYNNKDLYALQPGNPMSNGPLAEAIPDAIAKELGLDLGQQPHPVRPLEYVLDAGGKRVLVLVLALAQGTAVKDAPAEAVSEAGGATGGREDNEEKPLYLASIDLKTGKLEGPLEKLKTPRGDSAELLTADMVIRGAYKVERNDPDSHYRVLAWLGSSPIKSFQVGATKEDRALQPGGKLGVLRDAGEAIQLDRREDAPDAARPWFPLTSGAGDAIDFGLLDDGKRAFVAYERGSVQIWELSADGSKEVNSFDARMTLHKRGGRPPLAWSPNKQVIFVHDDTTIKAFDRSTGQLLRRTRPGSTVHQIVPLPNGELFAVVGSSTVVKQASDVGYRILKKTEAPELDAQALPLVAEALTMRWLGRSDPEIDNHWYLPRGARTVESIPECAATGGGSAPSMALTCRRIHADRSLPAGLRALAISEYVYAGMTPAWQVRGAAPLALAMARAGEGDAVAFALMARQLGKTSTGTSGRVTQQDYPITDARGCGTARLHAMRDLFMEAARRSRIVAPLHVALELQCDLGTGSRFDPIRKELDEAAAAGDALAIVLTGYDLELGAGNDPAKLEPVLEHYAVAGKLLLAQRDHRLPQERLPDQQLLEQIEDAIAWRRSRIVARLQTKDVARIWAAAAVKTVELQKSLAKSSTTGPLPGGAWYHKTVKTWEGKDVIANILRGEEALNKASGKKVARRITQLSLLAQFGFLHQDKGTPRSGYIEFLQRAGNAGVTYTSIFADAVIEIDKALEESERERGLGLVDLKRLAAHFAAIPAYAMTPEERAKVYPILANRASKLGKPELAGRLAIAALETSEDLPRTAANLTTLDNVQKQVLAIVKDAGMIRQLDKEFDRLGWNYIRWATDRSPAARAADVAKVVRVVHEGTMLQERYAAAQTGADANQARSRLASAYVNASLVAKRAGDIDLAIADLTKAIGISPHYDFAYGLRAEAYLAKRDNDSALADYDKAIEIDPGDASHRFARAKLLLEAGKAELALVDANEAMTLRPSDAVLFTRGRILERLDRPAEAARDYRDAYARNPASLRSREAALRLEPMP